MEQGHRLIERKIPLEEEIARLHKECARLYQHHVMFNEPLNSTLYESLQTKLANHQSDLTIINDIINKTPHFS